MWKLLSHAEKDTPAAKEPEIRLTGMMDREKTSIFRMNVGNKRM